jgi:short subunit dehydrogenase-like uncharacterized protein
VVFRSLSTGTPDKQSLLNMAAQTKVVLTTVGPFLRYGENLVEACVKAGTHYCDITGEPVFVRRMIDKYHKEAARNQVLIVPSCGCDCLFSDLGVLYVAHDAKKRGRTLKNGMLVGFVDRCCGVFPITLPLSRVPNHTHICTHSRTLELSFTPSPAALTG